jgi:hypothetical protein
LTRPAITIERETRGVTHPVDDERLRLLREILTLIDHGDLAASPSQISFLRGVEVGLGEAAPTPTASRRSRHTDTSTSETSPAG